jgi:hypothetical protein
LGSRGAKKGQDKKSEGERTEAVDIYEAYEATEMKAW